MEDEKGKTRSSFTNMAPRPWKSFKDEHSEVMVVQKISKTSIAALEKRTIEADTEGTLASDNDHKTDELVNNTVLDTTKESEKPTAFNPFDSEGEESVEMVRKIGIRSSKKRKAPQPPELPTTLPPGFGDTENSVKPGAASPLSTKSTDDKQKNNHQKADDPADATDHAPTREMKTASKSLNQTDADSNESTESVGYNSAEGDSEGLDVSGKQCQLGEEDEKAETHERCQNQEYVLEHPSQIVEKEKELVQVRTRNRLVDMTIRTSTIESLEDEDTLKSLTDYEGSIETNDQNAKAEDMLDEKDYERHEELTLNVNTLELTSTGNKCVEVKEKHEEEYTGRRISIMRGWSDYVKGIGCTSQS